MANLEKYLGLKESGQILVEICLLINERTSLAELTTIFLKSKDQAIKNLSNFSNNDLNSCAIDRFLVHRYSAIEPLDFEREEIFFEALKKPYFKNLCLGFYRFYNSRRDSYSWTWSEHFQVLGNLMKLYVFDEEFIENNDVLKNYFEKVNLDERWMISDKILGKIYLKGLKIEKFKRIPFPKIRIQLLEDAYSYLFYQMQIKPEHNEYLTERLHQIGDLATIQRLCHTLLYKNDKNGLLSVIENSPNDYTKILAEAHLAFINCDFELSLKKFEAQKQILKKLLGGKKNPFNISYFLAGLCMLFKKASSKEWNNFWNGFHRDVMSSSYLSIYLGILSNNAKIDLTNEWARTSDSFIVQNSPLYIQIFIAYAAFWSGRYSLSKLFLEKPTLLAAAENNAWLKSEIMALMALLDNEYEKLKTENVLWKIYAPKPEWEQLLERLDQLFSNNNTINKAEKIERIIFRFNPVTLKLNLVLQKINKSGSWSKGRLLSWEKINDLSDFSVIITDQDSKIISSYKKLLYHHSHNFIEEKESSLLSNVIENLVGHPNLYLENSNDIPLQIQSSKLELRLIKTTNGYHFENQYKDYTYGYQFVFKRETATRYLYIKINTEQQQLLQLLDRKKIVIPQKAESKIKETVKKMVSIMPIHSDLEIDHSNIPEHIYDSRIYVHILPVGEYFNVELFVKPFGEVPPYFSPGQGHERIIADVNGTTYFVQRMLNQEINSAEQLIASSEILKFDSKDGNIWILDNIESCLMLLSELNDLRKEEKIVIEWPQGEKLKISSYAGFDNLFLNLRSSGNWFELEGELKIDENTLVDMQLILEKNRKSKSRFLTLDDGTYLALTNSLHKRLMELDNLTLKHKNKLMISHFAGAALREYASDVHFNADHKWFDFIRKMEEAKVKEFELPETLNATLRPYQMEGYQWLKRMAWWGAGACLADDMGLGKTVQTIALLLSRANQGPALVVAPASVCTNWIGELSRFAPSLKSINFSLVQDRIETIENLGSYEILVCTYGLLHQAADTLGAKKFNTIILDEAQSIKNRFTKRSQAAMHLQGDFKVITTGTPMENHLGELWNLFHFINPGLLGSAQQFQERFAIAIERWGDKEKREQLQKLIKPFILRRLKKDVLKDLPDKTEVTLSIVRSEKEKAFYEALRQRALQNIQGGNFENEGMKRMQVLAELMRLRRCCCHPSLIPGGEKIPSSKLEALLELVLDLKENGHKALIFSQFVDYLRLIEKEIIKMEIPYQYLDGSTPLKKRKQAVDSFQEGDGDIFLISLKAGGTGLNLTAADFVIHVDPWWNPAVEDQASDRAHRIGQQNPVTVYRLVAENSIEEKIVKLHSSKREMADALLQDTDGKTVLNADEIIDLLKDF